MPLSLHGTGTTGGSQACELPARASTLSKGRASTLTVITPQSAPFQMTPISNVCSLVCSALKLSPDRAPQSRHCLCITLSPRPQTHYSSSAWGCQDNPCSIVTLQMTLAFSCCHPASQELLCCFLNTKTVSAEFLCVQCGSLQQEQGNQLIALHHDTDMQDSLEKYIRRVI